MKAKGLITGILLIFVAASVVYFAVSEMRGGSIAEAPETGAEAASDEPSAAENGESGAEVEQARPTVVAYYFHRNQRCDTCRAIEAGSYTALADKYQEAMDEGRLEWKAVNLDDPKNEHFIEDFELSSNGLVVALRKGGAVEEYKTLHEVWELVRDEPSLQRYVIKETAEYMEKV
jgi:hypothetical protein